MSQNSVFISVPLLKSLKPRLDRPKGRPEDKGTRFLIVNISR